MPLWTRRSRPNDHEPLTNNGWKAAFSWAFSLHPDLCSRSDRQTNQGTIQYPVLTVRSTPLCQMPSDSVLLSQHVSLYLFTCPHPMTKPTGKLSKENTFGCFHAMQAERITTCQLSYQGTFPTKRKKQSQKVIRNKTLSGSDRQASLQPNNTAVRAMNSNSAHCYAKK